MQRDRGRQSHTPTETSTTLGENPIKMCFPARGHYTERAQYILCEHTHAHTHLQTQNPSDVGSEGSLTIQIGLLDS